MKVIYVIVLRELLRFVRQPSRIIGMLVLPILFLFVLGTGIDRMMPTKGEISYRQFLLPGLLGIMILFSSFFSSLSIVYDKEFGFIRELLVAPVSRLSIVMGKVLGGVVIATLQGTLITIAAAIVGLGVPWLRIPLLIPSMALLSFAIAAFGVLIASRMGSMEGFQLLMTFILMPMLFLSGALFPISSLPESLQVISSINPVMYGVDIFKHVLLVHSGTGLLSYDFSIARDLTALGCFAAVMMVAGAYSFTRQQD